MCMMVFLKFTFSRRIIEHDISMYKCICITMFILYIMCLLLSFTGLTARVLAVKGRVICVIQFLLRPCFIWFPRWMLHLTQTMTSVMPKVKSLAKNQVWRYNSLYYMYVQQTLALALQTLKNTEEWDFSELPWIPHSKSEDKTPQTNNIIIIFLITYTRVHVYQQWCLPIYLYM